MTSFTTSTLQLVLLLPTPPAATFGARQWEAPGMQHPPDALLFTELHVLQFLGHMCSLLYLVGAFNLMEYLQILPAQFLHNIPTLSRPLPYPLPPHNKLNRFVSPNCEVVPSDIHGSNIQALLAVSSDYPGSFKLPRVIHENKPK